MTRINMHISEMKPVKSCDEPESFSRGSIVEFFDGRLVVITGGSYMGTHGVSNHFYWKPILPDGSLGPEEYGYWRKSDYVKEE
jgi:hypothetical protein